MREGARESGATLIELIITIAIVGIVLTTITLSVSMGFSTTADASSRLDRSNLADFTARYFASDAASSASDQTTATACPGGGTVLTILEADGSTVSYAKTAGTGGTSLVRRVCTGSSLTASKTVGTTSATFTAAGTCPTGAASGGTCPPGLTPSTLTWSLSVSWSDRKGGDFSVSGTRRVS